MTSVPSGVTSSTTHLPHLTNKAIPSAYNPHTINTISNELETIEQKEKNFLNRITAIDNQMKEINSLTLQIYSAQLDILQSFLDTPPKARNLNVTGQKFDDKMTSILDKHLEDYRSLLKTQAFITGNRIQVPLSKEKEEELIQSETKKAYRELQTHWSLELPFLFDPATDVNLEKSKLEAKIGELTAIYEQMQKSKIPLINAQQEIIGSPEYSELKKTKNELQQSPFSKNLWEASERGDIAFLKKEIDNLGFWQTKADLLNQLSSEGNGPLHLAAAHGQLKTVSFLLTNNADPNFYDIDNNQPLHWAAKINHIEIATLLVKAGAQVNGRCNFGRTPLHRATYNGHVEMAAFLLNQGADINARTSEKNDTKKTPLHEATIQQHLKVVSLLVKSKMLNVNIKDAQGWAPLYHAVLDGSLEIAALIVGHMSWQTPSNPKDPNHPEQLLQLRPRQNSEKIQTFLKDLSRQ